MGDYTHAEDLTQETFVRLFKYRKRYQPKAKFTTFLYTLARRAWIDHAAQGSDHQPIWTELA
jgi:RNA polymerase sigma-70 factor (ECF subfamily)